MDFGELKKDTNLVAKVNNIHSSLDKIEKHLQTALDYQHYDKLNAQEKVKFDLFLSYGINSLYWMYIKLQGIDPNTHDVKNELSRIRQIMIKEKQIHDRNTIRPVLDKGAAGRFIKHGLNYKNGRKADKNNHNQNENLEKNQEENENNDGPPNKIIKFNDDDPDNNESS